MHRKIISSSAMSLGLSSAETGLVSTGRASAGAVLPGSQDWISLLAKSLPTEHTYKARIEGSIPADLRGTLYRNGPGIFERGDVRKKSVLDGDGMIQALDFEDGRVRYRNRFVRTEKFVEEEKAGRFMNGTWSTRAPGGFLANLGVGAKSQAGVTTLVRGGKLLAFDEINPPYALDPSTLKTEGQYRVEAGKPSFDYKAHTKIDGKTGDWILFGTNFGRHMTLDHLVVDKGGKIKAKGSLRSPRSTYLHDFFVTERYIIYLLHPVKFSPLPMLLGMRSIMDCLRWDGALGNPVIVVDKDGKDKPVILEAPAAFMWHSLNAYERGDTIIAEFVGYDEPDHFIGLDPAFKAVMVGQSGNDKFPGKLRRYAIDLRAKTLRQEIVADAHYEFPIADPRVQCHASRFAHLTYQNHTGWFHDGISRVDMKTGEQSRFGFGAKHFVGEPIFAPSGGREGQGWLLAQVLSGETDKSFVAIFDAENVASGPVAKVMMEHHVPFSFHGWWQQA